LTVAGEWSVHGSRVGFPAGCELAVFRLRSGRRLGRDVAVMARGPVRESVTIAGRPERVAVARAFAAAVLGQHPAGETAVLLLSELVTNSVRTVLLADYCPLPTTPSAATKRSVRTGSGTRSSQISRQ
jgi:hypothetical protein